MSVCGEQWGMLRMTEKSVKDDGSDLHTKNNEWRKFFSVRNNELILGQ
jgi:hypothetical protein